MNARSIRILGWSIYSQVTILCCLLTALSVPSATAESQRSTADRPAQILLVGTFHFANPGLDVAQFEDVNILSEEKQAEVQNLVDRLLRFQPTKVAIEATTDTGEQYDGLYRAYVDGKHDLSVNERQQIGFRLAQLAKLSSVHPIDHQGEFDMGPLMAYASQNEPEFLMRFQTTMKQVEDQTNEMHRTSSISEIFIAMSQPDWLDATQALYAEIAEVGGGDTYVGADLTAAWFDRNIRIFANLASIAEADDRIIVLFGAGHVYMLRDLIRRAPNMELVDALTYLEP